MPRLPRRWEKLLHQPFLVGLEGFVRVYNNSGEEYEDAQVRLIVGRVNLVEKIAQLARLPVSRVSEMDGKERRVLEYRALERELVELGEVEKTCEPADRSGMLASAKPKQIIKEGLSEYFIYTIEGTETIPAGWSKRMRSLEVAATPFKIQYRYRPAEYGDQLVRMYLLANDKESKLGTTPLPDGVVRVFRNNGRDGLSFLAAQPVKYIPIGDKIELNLGPDPEVIFELVKLRTWRDTVWMLVNGTGIYRRADQPGVQIEVNSSVAGWDDHAIYSQRVRNYTKKPISLEVRRTIPGHVVFRSELPAKNHDYHTVEYSATVGPAEKADLLYELVQHQGRNAKQSNVTIEQSK